MFCFAEEFAPQLYFVCLNVAIAGLGSHRDQRQGHCSASGESCKETPNVCLRERNPSKYTLASDVSNALVHVYITDGTMHIGINMPGIQAAC